MVKIRVDGMKILLTDEMAHSKEVLRASRLFTVHSVHNCPNYGTVCMLRSDTSKDRLNAIPIIRNLSVILLRRRALFITADFELGLKFAN